MNDMNDSTQTSSTPDPQPAGFCQHCGRPLTTETIRQVGPAVYCEPCLAARLAGNPGTATPPPPGYRPVNAGTAYSGPVYSGPAYGTDEWMTQRLAAPGPNPGLAALLGLIPGVGAMYNEQYAKGVVHLIVFAVLVSLSDNVSGIFGLFVAGWIFYMAIEAHHTARARRDGTPLPNPFGLNDIGERLGFGKSWPHGPTVADVASDAAAAASAAAASFHTHSAQPPYQTPPPAETWGAPTDAYGNPTAYGNPLSYNNQAAYTQAQYEQQAAYARTYREPGFAEAVPPATPYAAIPPYDPNAFVPTPSRFPAGAVWLIGLGVIFLLTTTGIFNGIPGEALTAFVLLGIAAWIFLRRMIDSGAGFSNDGTPGYSYRVLRALRFSIWLGALGLLFLLDAFHILTWHHSWPFLVILAGVMAILQRVAYQNLATAPYMPPPVASAPASPSEPTQGGN